MKCCICGKEIKGWGNNPEGAVWKTHDGKIEMPEFKKAIGAATSATARS